MDPVMCPECQAPLQIIRDGFVEEAYAPVYHLRGWSAPTRKVRRPFAVCMRCEYCLDFLVDK